MPRLTRRGRWPIDTPRPKSFRNSRAAACASSSWVRRAPSTVIHCTGGPNWVSAEEYNTRTLRGLARIARGSGRRRRSGLRRRSRAFLSSHGESEGEIWVARYHVAGADGVHPAANGHLIIAYAFLKALGCDGNIGTIKVDLCGKRDRPVKGTRCFPLTAKRSRSNRHVILFVSTGIRTIPRAREESSSAPIQRRAQPTSTHRDRRSNRAAEITWGGIEESSGGPTRQGASISPRSFLTTLSASRSKRSKTRSEAAEI